MIRPVTNNKADQTPVNTGSVFTEEKESFSEFRRALRKGDQLALDELFNSTHKHLAATAYVAHALPFETFLLAMLLEEHKEVMRLRRRVEASLSGME